MLRDIIKAPLAATVLAATPLLAEDRSGRVEANGVSYYYEISGTGDPLLLLHGGLGSHDMFDPILPQLAEGRTIVGVDLHGHGRTPLGDRPIDLVAMGRDMAVILEDLGIGQIDVLGFSMGAGVGFQLAVQHPDKVRRLALVSGSFARDGFYPDILAQQAMVGAAAADMMKGTPMYENYVNVAPDPSEFPKLLDAMGETMRTPYDWGASVDGLARTDIPVMLVYGDGDMYRPEHIIEFSQRLGGWKGDAGWMRENLSRNRLAILPGATHYDILDSAQLVPTVRPFLDGESAVPNWAESIEAN